MLPRLGPERREPALAVPPPLRRWWVGAALLALVLASFLVKIPKGLNNHPVIGPFGDELHVVLFVAVTLLFYWGGPFRGRLWWVVAAAALAGAAIEFVQIPFGRSAQLKDFLLDLLGIGLVAGWILWRGERRPWGRWVFLVLLVALPLQMWRVPFVVTAATATRQRFPVIADFEGRFDGWLWRANMEADLAFVAIPDGPDGPTRVLRVTGAPPVNWPGALIRRFQRDWTGFTVIEADVRLVAGPADGARLGLRLDDVPGVKEEVWISKSFDVDREWRTIRFEFAGRRVTWGSKRVFDHADLEKIIFYLPKPQEPTTVEIDNLRLVPDPGPAD